jgi:hypothetical protein
MSTVAAFSGIVIERDLAAGERSRSAEESFQWSPQADTGYQATRVTFFDERREWLVMAYKKLAQFTSLRDDWDSYGAEAPNPWSVDSTRSVLRILSEADFEPTSIDASAEGGVCLSFQHGDRYGDVECLNSGEILAVTSAGGDATEVWEIKDIDRELPTTLNKIRTFVDH